MNTGRSRWRTRSRFAGLEHTSKSIAERFASTRYNVATRSPRTSTLLPCLGSVFEADISALHTSAILALETSRNHSFPLEQHAGSDLTSTDGDTPKHTLSESHVAGIVALVETFLADTQRCILLSAYPASGG